MPNQTSRGPRGITKVLMLIIVFFGTMWIYRRATQLPPYQPKYHTVAHHFLDLQNTYEPVTDDQYQLLDQVITAVKSRVRYDPGVKDPNAQRQQLLLVFDTIDTVLIENNFIFPSGEWTCTLSEALQDRRLSATQLEAALANPHNARRASHMRDHADEDFHEMACVPAAFLYMAIARELGFELKAVELPEHIFVRAQIDQTHWVNWDANRGRSISDQEYVTNWGVRDWQLREKIYMSPLSANQTEAEMYTNIGGYLGNRMEFRGPGPAIDALRRARALNPRDIYATTNLACDLVFQADPDPQTRVESLALAEAAEQWQPEEGFIHQNVAFAWAADGQTEAAVREMQRAVELEPNDQHMPYVLPIIESGGTEWSVYSAQGPIRFWIEYERGWIYLLAVLIAGVVGICIARLSRRAGRGVASAGLGQLTPSPQ